MFPAKGKESVEKVPTKTLTTLFEENDIKHVDFMKFDVEGAEDLILPSPDFEDIYTPVYGANIDVADNHR